MKLIIDANIIFAAIIKNSETRAILFNKKNKFYSPNFIIKEILKHEQTLLEKTKLSEKELKTLIYILLKRINIVNEFEFFHLYTEAMNLSPDTNDWQYIALAMKMDCAIWSNDKKLKEQKKVKIITTKQLKEST